MKKMFYIKNVRAWINPMHVVSLFRNGENWTASLVNGSNYNLTDDEYVDFLNRMGEELHTEEKK